MTVFELCSLLRSVTTQEVVIYDCTTSDCSIIFKDNAYKAMMGDFAECSIMCYDLALYDYGPILNIYITKEVS